MGSPETERSCCLQIVAVRGLRNRVFSETVRVCDCAALIRLLHWSACSSTAPPSQVAATGEPGPGASLFSAFLTARGSPCPAASHPRQSRLNDRGACAPPSLWRLTLDHRTRIQEPCVAGLQPHPADRGGLRGPRNPAVAVPEAGARQGRRQATASCWSPWWAASASAATASSACRRARLLRASGFGADAMTEVVTDGAGGRNARAATRWTSSRPTRSASRWRCGPGCRAFAAAWPATSATTRCATSRRSWRRAARPTRWAARTSCCCSARSWRSSTTCRASCT